MIGHILRSLVCLGSLWLASCGDSLAPETDWPEASPAIWEVRSSTGNVGWVFGTVHALPDDLDWGSELLDETLAHSGVLVVEVANLDDPAGMGLFADLSETPGQPPLLERVAPSQRPALRALVEDAGMTNSDFGRIESWAAAMTLSAQVRAGDPSNGVDRAMIRNAEDIVGLESFASQLGMFDTLSKDAQNDLLYGVARSHAANSAQTMLLAWLTGDEDAMAGHVNDALESSAELKRVLITDRNRRWVVRVAELIDAGRKPFVAVGAGHVAGEEGLVALLARRGYDTRRIQ